MLSKKSYNGSTTTTAKSIYDDVFGGPPKFGAPTLSPRVEDYSEIFGGFHSSRATSIPVLDLPLVDDEADEVFFDFRSSVLDYGEIFGGFNGHDFAVSYDELMTMEQSNGCDDSSDEAWTPAEAEILLEGSDHSAHDQCLSNGDSCESINSCMEFNISYNQASKKCDEGFSNGIRHITQLPDVSGYTFVVDRATPLPKTDHEYCFLPVRNDDHLNIDYSGEMLSGRHLKKVMSNPAIGSNDGLFFKDDAAARRDFVRNGSFLNEMFLTISDVNLRTRPSHLPPPSRPPPAVDGKKVDSGEATPNCKTMASDESGDSSPPYFDVEVDASSSAATKEAMGRARVKIKSAKESMERKREHTRSKSVPKNDRREKEEKVSKIDSGSSSKKNKRGQGIIQRGDENAMEYAILEDRQKFKKATQQILDTLEGKNLLNVNRTFIEDNHGRESLSSQGSDKIDVAGEWKEATQFFELVTNKSKKVIEQENSENFVVRDSNFYDSGNMEKQVPVVGLQQHQENGKNVEAVKAGNVLGKCEKKSGVMIRNSKQEKSFEKLEVANKQKRFDKTVHVTEESPRENEDDKKFSMDLQPLKMGKKEMMIEVGVEKEENEKREKAAVEQGENEKKQKKVHVTEDAKQQRKTYERKVGEIRFQEALEKEKNAEGSKEACGNEVGKRLDEVCERAENSTFGYYGEVEDFEPRLKEDEQPEEIGNVSLAKYKGEQTEMGNMDASESGNQTGLNKMGEDYIKLNQGCSLKNNAIHGTNQLAGNHEDSTRKLNITKETAHEETGKMFFELGSAEKEANSAAVLENFEHNKRQFQTEDVTISGQKHGEKIKSTFRADLDSGNQVMGFGFERNERGNNTEQTHISLDQGNDKVNFKSAGAVKEPIETGMKTVGVQPDRLEVKGSSQRTTQQVNASQSTDRKVKNSNETLPPEEKEFEKMKRERELEKERLRKIEEEREREREREKDRMAVDKATLETREWAYAEARERAERAAVERATAEVRQRALNEARERLEKACAEAREKSFPDKASIEARIKAERAAVERATAEARERAFEKAMAERAAFEARERVERSVSDKFSASSRNTGIRPSSSSSELQDLQSQGAGTFNGSRYQQSSVYNDSNITERFEGVEVESPQRCKARLERHRRTAERAAKALAEKNMRDLLAQREQAERNRLAETLDADVRRWSSGKEGNLRALLSTLQYILGADSGWQPIPLTEVITAAAVKKAYRKATLCVHPDKLQQRCASIQQKYICEKVFDLLKEAWTKFNSEER